MGLESLFAFTLLGGMAAGAYVFETCFARKRSGNRPWLLPLVVVALFAIGMSAASTHVQSIPRAMGSLTSGTVNFASGMVREVAVSGVFFVLALIDMIIAFVKKDSPFALRVVTAVVAVACMVLMLPNSQISRRLRSSCALLWLSVLPSLVTRSTRRARCRERRGINREFQ